MEKKHYYKPSLGKIRLDNEISVLMLSTGTAPGNGAGNQSGTEDQEGCVSGCFINPLKWLIR